MKNLKFIIILIIIILGSVVALYSNKVGGKQENNINEFGFRSVDAIEFSELIENNPDSFLLDVHIPEQEHIPGTDAIIPFNEISQNLDKLPSDKNKQILVYCRSGSMSRQAATELVDLGYTNVVELTGGINAYKKAKQIKQ